MARFYLHTFGCRANQADGAAITQQFEAAGWTRTSGAGDADLVILNTCTVTAAADAEARQAIRRARRESPSARILVTGCYAQRAAQEIAALQDVDWVVGNDGKQRIGLLAPRLLAPEHAMPKILSAAMLTERHPISLPETAPAATTGERTRPHVKVQDGCNRRCAYCVIPQVRGASRSLPLGKTLATIEGLVNAGYHEAVLTGINLGQWGRDLDGQLRLADLVAAILNRTRLRRLRLSSVEPMDWSEDLIALMASERRIARHVHIPLQSGSDRVLRRMRRRYRCCHYAAIIHRIAERVPGVAIGADVLTGFPGESEAEFEETCRFVTGLPFSYLHVFSYSTRPGTEAARRLAEGEDWAPVTAPTAAARSRTLRDLSARKRAAFAAGFIGSEMEVITLSEGDRGRTPAITDNYLPITVTGEFAPNRWLKVRLTTPSDSASLDEGTAIGMGCGLDATPLT